MGIDAAAITPSCVLAPIDHAPAKGECVWCGGPLPKGSRRWCSRAHVDLFLANHEWTSARWAAIARGSYVVDWWSDEMGGHARTRWTYCDQCGLRCNRKREPREGDRPWADLTIADSRPEVNHVEPRLGQGYDKGCWNHQTNLQVLCHGCHVQETTRQLRERKPWRCHACGGTWDAQGGHDCPVMQLDMPSLWDSISA